MRIFTHNIAGTFNRAVFLMSDEARIETHAVIIGEEMRWQIMPDAGTDIKPTFIMREDEWKKFVSEISRLAKKEGIENETESVTKGKLEATEKHLEDMRKLVFEPVASKKFIITTDDKLSGIEL